MNKQKFAFDKTNFILLAVGMAIIIFMALLFSGLIGKMISFVSMIITEIAYRM